MPNFGLGSPVWEPTGKYLRAGELPAQRLQRGTGVSTSSHHACPLKRNRSSQLPLPIHFRRHPQKKLSEGNTGRGTNSLKMVLESHVEVKSIPSVDKADSDESSAAWGRRKSKGWNREAAEEEGGDTPSHTFPCPPPPPAGGGTPQTEIWD